MLNWVCPTQTCFGGQAETGMDHTQNKWPLSQVSPLLDSYPQPHRLHLWVLHQENRCFCWSFRGHAASILSFCWHVFKFYWSFILRVQSSLKLSANFRYFFSSRVSIWLFFTVSLSLLRSLLFTQHVHPYFKSMSVFIVALLKFLSVKLTYVPLGGMFLFTFFLSSL